MEISQCFQHLHPCNCATWVRLAALVPGGMAGAGSSRNGAASEKSARIRDSRATTLHLLGLDHTLLTDFTGRCELRWTDVPGRDVRYLPP